MHDVIWRLAPITEPQNMITYWYFGDHHILEVIITWNGWTVVQAFKNIQNASKYKKDSLIERSFDEWMYSNDPQNTDFDHLPF